MIDWNLWVGAVVGGTAVHIGNQVQELQKMRYRWTCPKCKAKLKASQKDLLDQYKTLHVKEHELENIA